jgi:hypothetical protein
MRSSPTTPTRSESVWPKVINKFAAYRFIAPFRSRRQARLRRERMSVDVDTFAQGLEGGDRRPEIAHALWELLRERAFVDDFRPDPNDSLYEVFGMDAEIVRDEVVDKLLNTFDLSVSGFDFTGFDFASIATPKDVSRFVVKIADAQEGEGKQRISNNGGLR